VIEPRKNFVSFPLLISLSTTVVSPASRNSAGPKGKVCIDLQADRFLQVFVSRIQEK
jgi:hypothetical protein